MSKEGFSNEKSIINAINNNKIGDLNSNLKAFVLYIFKNTITEKDIIQCSLKAGQNKADIAICVKEKTYNISIKSGTGNSVHQEPIEEFILFLEKNYNISNSLSNDLRFFIWGDGTYDGSGEIKNRIDAREFLVKYPDLVNRLRHFFSPHKEDLLNRFVINGSKSIESPDFIYYGKVTNGCWAKKEDILKWLLDKTNESTGTIPLGRLTFQAWNRNLKGGNKSEHKRGVIQLKWGSIGEDLLYIMNRVFNNE